MRRVGAGVAVLKAGEVLLIRRGDDGLWDVPGGSAEAGEAPEHAARRELAEETGLYAGVLRPLAVFQHPYIYPDGNVVEWETHLFMASFCGGAVQAGDDAQEARWWPLDALPQAASGTTARYFEALGQAVAPSRHARS
jgi:8-oxo-dGTP diphosphatase